MWKEITMGNMDYKQWQIKWRIIEVELKMSIFELFLVLYLSLVIMLKKYKIFRNYLRSCQDGKLGKVEMKVALVNLNVLWLQGLQ